MRAVDVIDKVKIGDDTLIAVKDHCNDLKNGSGILDEEGKLHVISSISMCSKGDPDITNILLKGEFNSTKIFI